jgi:hypothetical protein
MKKVPLYAYLIYGMTAMTWFTGCWKILRHKPKTLTIIGLRWEELPEI